MVDRRSIGAVAIGLSALVLTSFATVSNGATSAADPKKLVLRLADMPSGFVQKSARYIPNRVAERQAAKDDECPYRFRADDVERIMGYEVEFEKPGFATTALGSGATVHRSVAGTRRMLASWERSFAGCRTVKFRRASVGARIGYEARMWRVRITKQGFTVEGFYLTWRYRTMVGSVSAAGFAGAINPRLLVKLAKRQQARMARAA